MRRFLGSSSLHFFVLALCGFILVLWITSVYGPGISTDAVSYISGADHLAQGQGLVDYQGAPLVSFGPLYPVLLAIPRVLLGMKPANASRYLNALSFAAIIFVTAILIQRLLPERRSWAYYGALAVLLSPSLIAISANVLSDPLFIVLELLFFGAFVRYTDRRDWLSMLSLVGISALASLLRYVGVALIVAGCLSILWVERRRFARGVSLALLLGFSAVSPLAIWSVINYTVTHTAWGMRNLALAVPLENVQDVLLKVTRWLVPVPSLLSALFILALLVVLGCLIGRSSSVRGRGSVLSGAHPAIILPFLFLPVYLMTIIFLSTTADHSYIAYDDRYYLPLYVPGLLVAFIMLQALVVPFLRARFGYRADRILLGLFALWSVVPLSVTAWFAFQSREQRGIIYYNIYNTRQFRESDVTEWLNSGLVDSSGTIYSNNPAAVYLATRRSALLSPVNADIYGRPIPLIDYVGVWPGSFPAWLVWYEPNYKLATYPLDDLLRLVTPEQMRRSYYGSIYRLWPPKPKGPG